MTEGVITPATFAGLTVEKPQAQTPHINVLVYGKSSIGKTTLAASADAVPAMRKVLLLDCEKGTLSVRKTGYNVDVLKIDNWNQLVDVYNALRAGGHNYNTVILDSLTEIQDMNMRALMALMKEDPDNVERDPDVPGMYEWNKSSKQMKKLIRGFRDLPLNVIFTALMKEDKDPKTGMVMKLPDLPGKLGHQVPALFDMVFYYTAIDTEAGAQRVIASTASSNTVAKNRGSDKLPPVLEIPPVREKAAMALIYPLIVGENE